MSEQALWTLFLQTGHPVFYTLYRHLKTAVEREGGAQTVKTA